MASKSTADTDEEKKNEETETKGPFSDPVFKQLSRINGEINKMTVNELRGRLNSLKLDTRGTKEVLKKRMKNHYKKIKLAKSKVRDPLASKLYHYFCIIDFEATCEAHNQPNYKHEIIEFPAVLINVEDRKIVSEFHEYCQPLINPKLSDFCSDLTGITQGTVKAALPFPEVLKKFEKWLADHKHSYAVITDGPWDMSRFLAMQCDISNIPYPKFAKKWVNIRKIFTCFYQSKRLNLKQMLEFLGLAFEGRPHCGLDDARNIGRIVLHLLNDGANIRINERIDLSSNEESSNRQTVYLTIRTESQSSLEKKQSTEDEDEKI
uniref:3'-5' exoribonuclease 1 n=1 Tax=Strigamia maritima TaxID=126957 RepID=T1J0Y4_STRMM